MISTRRIVQILLNGVFALGAFTSFCPAPAAYAQLPFMKTVLYGVSYYHEYMPYERLEQDVRMMEEAGLTVVRLGESTWSSWEPREGEFQFAWMDKVVDRLHGAGIKIILGTPTYSIPPWLYKKHPEILVTRLGGIKSGYGPRQNMDITSTVFRLYAERVIRNVIGHYKDHPAVIGYQIDNETNSYGTAGPNVQQTFVEYLKGRFKTTDTLNKVWGLTYWGQDLRNWDEVPPRDEILNPGWKLEWERFQQNLTTEYLAWQASIINEYKRKDQFIVHDFEGGVRTSVDAFAIARNLDVVGTNPYHDVQDALDGQAIALSGDFSRSLKQNNYLVTETNAQTIGWDSKWQNPPYDGQLRLNVYSHISSGANMVEYWHWHSLHYGQETYWKGVLSHDLEPNRTYAEVSKIGKELRRLGPHLVNFRRSSHVAILYSIDSYHGIRFMPFHDKVDYMTILNQMYKAAYRANVGVDFITPETSDFSRYRVIIVPPLYIAEDALLQRLTEFVRQGGHLVTAFKSGFCNEYSTVRTDRMPGLLRKAAGFSYQEFSSLYSPLELKGDPFHTGKQNNVSVWAEMLQPEGAEAIATYDHPFFGRYPAITRNQFGSGSFTYEGTVLSDELQHKVILDVLGRAGLAGPDQQLPEAVRLKEGLGSSGKTTRYYLNFSGRNQNFTYPYTSGVDLLTERKITKGENVTLAAWDLVIIEER